MIYVSAILVMLTHLTSKKLVNTFRSTYQTMSFRALIIRDWCYVPTDSAEDQDCPPSRLVRLTAEFEMAFEVV